MDETNRVVKSYGIGMYGKKTKVINIDRVLIEIAMNWTLLEPIEDFKYPGNLISTNGLAAKSIRVPIARAKKAFGELNSALTGGLRQEM